MANTKAFAVFQKKGGNIFRPSAYLQWGTKTESIGSFLLLNPGSAQSAEIEGLEEGLMEQHKIELDPTMKQMVKLVESLYDTKALNGRVHIYNLFTLRNPTNENAIAHFEQLTNDALINPLEDLPVIEVLQEHPWICCAWGINSQRNHKHLQLVKSAWNQRLEEAGVLTFGKRHHNGTDYYHLRPQLLADQEKLIHELTEIYRGMLKASYWVSVVYFEKEYIIIIDEEPFEEVTPIMTIDCQNLKEIQTTIKVLQAVYEKEGNVHVESLISEAEVKHVVY